MPDAIQEQVWAVVQAMMEAYSERDLEAALSFFADVDELACIGSGPGEVSLGMDGLRQGLSEDFTDTDAVLIDFGWRQVGVNGQTAWVATQCSFHVEGRLGPLDIATRLSCVLIRHQGAWRIVHSHLSLPFPPDDD